MKVIAIIALVLAFLAVANADLSCRGKWAQPNCRAQPSTGTRRGQGCQNRAGTMWFYNGRQCVSFNYLGCGGTANRFCSLEHCRATCQSRSPSPGK